MTTSLPEARPAHVGWRLLALVYDLFPVFALCLVFGALVTGLASVLGHPDLSDLPWAGPLLALGTWAAAGSYVVMSWARGGQTMGMRPWQLRVVAASGQPASRKPLLIRYASATAPAIVALELGALLPWPSAMAPFWLAGGVLLAGWLWGLVDREGVLLHDRLSGTRLVRVISGA